MMAVGGDTAPKVSYVLAELDDMENVFVPIKTASRVKYTCFDVSRHYFAFGTTTGSVIILQHDSLTYLKTVSGKEGSVCRALFSPDESMIGFASSRGVTIVMEHNADRGTTPPQRLQLSYEHKGSTVTALHWNVSSSKLFVGDDRGKVSVISVTTSRARNIFQVPTATLVKLDSKVIQLDFAQNHLLVSTMSRCYLCNTNREQFLQIGKKLRDGEYGACFYPGYKSNEPCTVYCARPGSRIWEVDIKGEVHCTHQFKNALAIKPERLFSFRNEVNMDDVTVDAKPHATAFNKLLLIWPTTEDLPFIFTWGSLAAYVFDPKRAQVVLWTADLKGIKDVKCQRGDVYIHFQDGKFAKYTLMTVEHAVCRLYQQGLAIHSAQLLLLKQASLCAARLNIHVPPSFLLDMLQRVSDLGKTYLFSSLSAVFGRLGLSPDKLSQSSRSSSAMSEPMRLGSGIYVVNRIVRDIDESSTSVCLSRWRSASPVFRYHSPHSSPSRQSTSLSSPVRRKRSGTMPSVKVKEAQYRTRTVPSVADTTPDSIDSGASGKTSDFSDDTHSSPSSKDFKPNVVALNVCDNYSLENKQNLIKLKDSLYNVLSTKQNGHLENQINGEHSVQNPATQIAQSELRESANNLGQKISLNLSDLSLKNIPTGKHVSFETKQMSSESSKSIAENYSDKVELKYNSDILNGFDTVDKNIGYEVAEEATCDMYPDTLYEETYSYMNMSLYGMMVPNVDFSLIFGTDRDFQNIKESLANKITTGKNLLKKGFEHIKQSQNQKSELLDVKPKKSMSEMSLSLKATESESSLLEKQEESKFWSFLPPFDNSALVEASKIAKSKVHDPEVLFNSANLRMVLEEWVMYLHAAQKCIISLVHNFCQSSFSGGTHSYKDDDTIRSTGSLVTSGGSTPSEGGDPSDKLETEEMSISDSKSFDEEKHAESTSSWNTEISDSSTLKTESLQRMLSVEDFVFVHDPFRLCKEDHAAVAELAMMCFQLKIWGNISNLHEATILLRNKKSEGNEKGIQESDKKASTFDSQGIDSDVHVSRSVNGEAFSNDTLNSNLSSDFVANPKSSSSKELPVPSVLSVPKSSSGSNLDPSSYVCSANFKQSYSVPKINLINIDLDLKQHTGDSLSAMFIQNYFHLVDVQRLRELLVIRNEHCILTWNVMLKGVSLLNSKDEFMQKINSGQLDSAANSLERNVSGAQLISHLLRLFRAKPSRAIELCLHRSYHVTPLDVLYLSKSSNMLPEFINYVSCVIDCLTEIQRPKVLEKLLTLDEVRWEWICGILQNFKSTVTKCKCGWPRPGSHLYIWQYSELALHVIKTSMTMAEELLNLCFNSGYWKGYLWLVKKLNHCDIHQQALVHLADVSLFSNNSDLGYLPSNIDEWKQLCSLISKLEQSVGFATCISCGEKHTCRTNFHKSADSSVMWETTLHWETTAKLALKSLGPVSVLTLLKGIEIPPGTLSPAFYNSIIQTHLMDKQQSALSHRMLTNVGSYMWSRRPTSFSPELHQLFRKEKAALHTDVSAEYGKSINVSKEGVASVSKPSKYYLEEPESHWGVSTCLRGPCMLCKLPLTSHLTLSASGIIICACGHAYHSVCLPSGICLVCIKISDEGK